MSTLTIINREKNSTCSFNKEYVHNLVKLSKTFEIPVYTWKGNRPFPVTEQNVAEVKQEKPIRLNLYNQLQGDWGETDFNNFLASIRRRMSELNGLSDMHRKINEMYYSKLLKYFEVMGICNQPNFDLVTTSPLVFSNVEGEKGYIEIINAYNTYEKIEFPVYHPAVNTYDPHLDSREDDGSYWQEEYYSHKELIHLKKILNIHNMFFA